MPQLNGEEQKILVELLVEHLPESGALDRALLHSGLGSLSKLSEKGTLYAMTTDLVRAMSSQFRVIEFVEAILLGDFLKGHCPPIETWLAENRAELLRRKLHPTINERIARLARPLLTYWLLLPVALIAVAWGYWNFTTKPKVVIGPLKQQTFDLQQYSALITIYEARASRGMRDLTDDIARIADSGDYGQIILCNPLEQSFESPTVEVKAFDADGNRLDDPDAIIEIHWLPPDRDREEQGRWSARLHLEDGVVTDKHEGFVPAGTIITVVYHRKEPRTFPPTFDVYIK